MSSLRGACALLIIVCSTMVLCVLLFLCSIGKLLAPTERWRSHVRHFLSGIAETWISVNNAVLTLFTPTKWEFSALLEADPNGCYLVSCNHQSWADILTLQRCFNRKLPLLRFFLKQQLIWVPFLGVAWWALDFPFMRRYSRAEVSKNPSLRGKDLENARKACEKFRQIPVAMMSFPEGTRFSQAKREQLGSPYQNLLPAKIGGIGQVLFALGDELDGLVDVTIAYPDFPMGQAPTFWQLVSGQIPRVRLEAELREIPAELRNRDFRTDRGFRGDLQKWMDQQWQLKDQRIDTLRSA